jgi:hypothetical protein
MAAAVAAVERSQCDEKKDGKWSKEVNLSHRKKNHDQMREISCSYVAFSVPFVLLLLPLALYK